MVVYSSVRDSARAVAEKVLALPSPMTGSRSSVPGIARSQERLALEPLEGLEEPWTQAERGARRCGRPEPGASGYHAWTSIGWLGAPSMSPPRPICKPEHVPRAPCTATGRLSTLYRKVAFLHPSLAKAA